MYFDDISGPAAQQGARQGRCPADAATRNISLIDADDPVDVFRAFSGLYGNGGTEAVRPSCGCCDEGGSG